jgi:nucleotide-binding universal stress UspA family protein
MIKTILVRATGAERDEAGFAAAGMVARLFAAHVDALLVRVDPIETAVAMSTEGSGGVLLQGIIDSIERDADAAETKARARFTALSASEGLLSLHADPPINSLLPSSSFHVEIGQEPRWMSTYGLTSDLAVIPRGASGEDAVARSTLEALLFDTGRPVLIPVGAPAPDFATRITIAWKATPQAARAVAFAMPFLAQASEITILSIEEEDGPRDDPARLVRHLGWHGIRARSERLRMGGDGGPATLLAAAKAANSGLLVMGAYGHTRLREWVFGGFTQRALDHADLPVLMAH